MRAMMLGLLTAGMAFGAAPPARPTAEQERLLKQLTVEWKQAHRYWKAGKREEEVKALERVQALELRVFGLWHRETERTAGRLGDWARELSRWEEEAKYRLQVIEARQKLDGENHWRVVDARLELEEARSQPGRTVAQRERLAEARRLNNEVAALYRKGEVKKAIPLAHRALKLREEVLGRRHPDYATSLNNLALLHNTMGDHRAALPLYQQALKLYEEVLGRRHPSYATSLNNLAGLYKAILDHEAALPLYQQALKLRGEVLGEKHPQYASSLHELALLYQEMGDYKAALPLYRQALKLYEEVLGSRHPSYASSLNSLALLYQEMGDYKAALPLYRQALKLTEEVQGRRHPDYATSLNNLAYLYQAMGDPKSALPLYQQALKLTEEVLGRRHPAYATSLNNLAGLHKAMGDPKAALPLYQQALKIEEEVLGRRHPSYATSLNNLASLFTEMGDYRAALPLFQQVLKLTEEVLGRRHPRFASSLNNLALLHAAMGDHKAALPLYRQALKLREEVLGRRHPHYAISLNNLAGLHQAMGDHKAALPLYQQALKLTEEVLGRRHPDYADSFNNLALLHLETGDHKAALPLFQQALKLTEEVLGRRHPDYARSLNSLAGLHLKTGDHKTALPLFQQALKLREEALGRRHPLYASSLNNLAALYLEAGRPGSALILQEQALYLTRRHLNEIAAVQSERQQIAAAEQLRYRLNWRLSIPDEPPCFGHDHVLAWKGSTFAAQQARRRFLLAEADPATRALALELRDAARSLSLLASRTDDASRKRVENLMQEKERLEARLSQASEPFRLAVRPPTSEALRTTLPPGTVLLDFLVHTGYDPARPRKGQKAQRRLVCWVVRPDAATVRVDLGSMRPVEERIAAWRKALEEGGDGGAAPDRLRELVWAPLEKHLAGAKVVLVSPDEAVGRLPFAALPGKEKGKYLLEEVPLAVLPVPQVLAQVLERPKGKSSLLALGGVAYGGKGTWAPLPATGPEADAIASRFRTLLKGDTFGLSGAKATRAALREALPKHRFAHLATHGYFAPASMKSALDIGEKERPDLFGREGVSGWDPALLSGLVLAGANKPTLEDDGVLKASEVAEMDLSGVELAVLSACQTGLGKEAGGEGILGLQRAFAVAGAKSVVTSLWSVHDAATAVMMERFYHHLWEKKRGKLDALRQAQLEVMRHPEWVEERIKKLTAAGIVVRGIGKAAVTLTKGERQSPPAWWAAWQLSGDWR